MAWADEETPADWMTSWSEDGTTISVDIADIPELTAAEADATTGDIRKVIYALCKHFYDTYDALVAADVPTNLTISSSEQANQADSTTTVSYTFQFNTTATGRDVTDEPA